MGYRVKKDLRWPEGKIYYKYKMSKDYPSEADIKLMEQTMRLWETFVNTKAKKTLIQFIKCTGGESHYVEMNLDMQRTVQRASGSAGGVGREAKVLKFNMLNSSVINAIPHELAHTIGIVHEHEQNNPDDVKKWGDELRLYFSKEAAIADGRSFIADDLYRRFKAKATTTDYVKVGDYDLQSITHYPRGSGLTWTKAEYNKGPRPATVLNYPSADAVKDGTWAPSEGNLETIIDLYTD